MATVIRGLCGTGIGTSLWGVTLGLAECVVFVAHVGVVALGIEWSVDSTAYCCGTIKAWASWGRGVLVVG